MKPTASVPETVQDCIRHLIQRLPSSSLQVDIPFITDLELEENVFFVHYPNGKEFKITVQMFPEPTRAEV
jgi:hypothetical protein